MFEVGTVFTRNGKILYLLHVVLSLDFLDHTEIGKAIKGTEWLWNAVRNCSFKQNKHPSSHIFHVWGSTDGEAAPNSKVV